MTDKQIEATAFFSKVRTRQDCLDLLGRHGVIVYEPTDGQLVSDQVVDVFMNEMIDLDLCFKSPVR